MSLTKWEERVSGGIPGCPQYLLLPDERKTLRFNIHVELKKCNFFPIGRRISAGWKPACVPGCSQYFASNQLNSNSSCGIGVRLHTSLWYVQRSRGGQGEDGRWQALFLVQEHGSSEIAGLEVETNLRELKERQGIKELYYRQGKNEKTAKPFSGGRRRSVGIWLHVRSALTLNNFPEMP